MIPEQLNPFKKERQNFPGVVIPLAQAPAHRPSNLNDEKTDLSKDDKPEDMAERGSAHGSASSSQHEATHLTLEGLRAEIEADLTGSHSENTTYDRMYLPL